MATFASEALKGKVAVVTGATRSIGRALALAEADVRRWSGKLQQALDAFGEEGLLGMTYLAGNYFATCALLNVFAVLTPQQ